MRNIVNFVPLISLLYCNILFGTCSGAFGSFRSPVLLFGTLYRIISMIQH